MKRSGMNDGETQGVGANKQIAKAKEDLNSE